MPDWIVPILLLLLAFLATLEAAFTKNERGKRELTSPWSVAIAFFALVGSGYVYFEEADQQRGRDELDEQVNRTVQRIDSATNEVISKFGDVDKKLSVASDSIDTANVRLSNVLSEMDESLIRNRELAMSMNRQTDELSKQFRANKPLLIVYTDTFDTITTTNDNKIRKSLQTILTNTGKREARNILIESLSIYSLGQPTNLDNAIVYRTQLERIDNMPPGSQLNYTVHDFNDVTLDNVDNGLLAFKIQYEDGGNMKDTTTYQYIKFTDEVLPKLGNFRIYQNEYKDIYNRMFLDGDVPTYFIFD